MNETTETSITKKRAIDKETKEWSRDLDTTLPINGSEFPGFKAWINWNGLRLNKEDGEFHDGFDFAAYITTDNRIVLGLPEDTKVRAVADGMVKQIPDSEFVGGRYGVFINIEHGADGSGMFSHYTHVKPMIKSGVRVKKGDVIGELFKDPDGKRGRLVHLHFNLTSGYGTRGTPIYGGGFIIRTDDPVLLDSNLYKYTAVPQCSTNFTLPDFPNVKVELAHFKKVMFSK